ncbi:serine/threonine-protein kinase [Desulfovibrio subterraneus]|uniref:Protein kinase domain-containing protein n=1 Tax=Desulfovibrio subterraneus TaxID=2718620 RepID=A0A7J0BM38_9BACT|nr:serine/threonine-protein kinase [Desulfovibrio subterraneus]GFM34225.1 hypothetical protein DSM101010T_25900 [Desulfovibrio subterraneus]
MADEEVCRLLNDAGKYRIEDEIFEGRNADSFKAHHLHLGRDVFLKVYWVGDELADIFAEPQLLVTATANEGGSDYIVRVLDAEKLGGDYVLFATEWIEGGSLSANVADKCLSQCQAVSIAKGVLQGVSFLHRNGFVHRDLKPGNILVASTAAGLQPKICDFGSMARLPEGGQRVRASRNSALYLPPEGNGDDGFYTVRSDVYQVGLLLGEMVNGQLPYDENSYLDRESRREIRECGGECLDDLNGFDRSQIVSRSIARKAQRRQVLSLVQEQPYYDVRLKRIVNRATAPDPALRYGTALEMLTALNNLSCPDWCTCEDGFLALGWRGYDWKIVEIVRRGVVQGYSVKRSNLGAGSFRGRGVQSPRLADVFQAVRDGV